MENHIFQMCEIVKFVKINKYLESSGVHLGDVGIVMLEERNGYLDIIVDGFMYEDRHGEFIIAIPDIEVGVALDYVVPATDDELKSFNKAQINKWLEAASKEEIEDLYAYYKKYGH